MLQCLFVLKRILALLLVTALDPVTTTIKMKVTTSMNRELPCISEQPQVQVQHNHPAAQAEQVNMNMTQQKPSQPINFKFPSKRYVRQTHAFQSKWFTEFLWLHYNEQNDSVFYLCTTT